MKVPAEINEMRPFKYLEVEVTGSFEEAARKFKSLVQKSKVLSDYREKQRFEKKSDKKRRKKRESIERARVAHLRSLQSPEEREKRQRAKEEKRRAKLATRKEDQS